MLEEERLRVQNSVSLSITLISFSVALIAGTVAGFLTIADKLNLGWNIFVPGVLVILSFLFLIGSIYFGGTGIGATNDSIIKNSSKLDEHYDGGNFNFQAVSGVGGLVLGVVGFVWLGFAAVPSPNATEQHLKKIDREIQDLRSKISEVQGQTRAQAEQISALLLKQRGDVAPPERTSPAESRARDLPHHPAPSKRPSSGPNN